MLYGGDRGVKGRGPPKTGPISPRADTRTADSLVTSPVARDPARNALAFAPLRALPMAIRLAS